MKRATSICLIQIFTATFLLCQSNPAPLVDSSASAAASIHASQAGPKAKARIVDGYGRLPLRFEVNQGQTDARIKFLSHTGSYTLFLTANEALFTLPGKRAKGTGSKTLLSSPLEMGNAPSVGRLPVDVLGMKLRDANPAANIVGVDVLPGTSNYFIGSDPAKWRTNVPAYAKVKYEGVYPGVDLVYYGNQRQLEYDFIVAPGADPGRIAFDLRGMKRIQRNERGDLILKIGEAEVRWHRPVAYQQKNGTRQEIAARYAIADSNRIGFELAKYDRSRPLYIDPLVYSTFLGGSGADAGYGIALDSAGNAYISGSTGSTDFPTTPGAFQTSYGGNTTNAFVTKLNSTGTALVYSTYLGGSGGANGTGIVVDSSGNAYVTGNAGADFPVTPGALQTTYGGNTTNAFVTKLNSIGTALVYSTYLGGSGGASGTAIGVDSSGNAYATGAAGAAFPVTPGAFQTTYGGNGNAFVAELNRTGAALVYSTYLGGSGGDGALGIAVDSTGSAYVTGKTFSPDFPVTPGVFQPVCVGYGNPHSPYPCFDAFVTKLNAAGSALVFSTHLGGSGHNDDGIGGNYGTGIAVDNSGNTYVTGTTASKRFPTTPGAFQPKYGFFVDAFVTKFNPTGSSLIYSSYLGGLYIELGGGIAVDGAGNAYVTGQTSSSNFPTTPGAYQTTCAGRKHEVNCTNAFITEINAAGSNLLYSTYLGWKNGAIGTGIAVDSSGNAYLAGSAGSDFPVTPGAFQTTYGGGNNDAFVTKIQPVAGLIETSTSLTSSPNPSTYGQAVTFVASVSSVVGTPPDGETVSFMKGKTVLGSGTLSGGLASFVTSSLKVGSAMVKAVYSGDSKFAGSKVTVKQVVNPAAK